MARIRYSISQEPEPDPTSTDEASEMEDDASASEALEQEGVAEEGEENDQDSEIEEDEEEWEEEEKPAPELPARPPVEWENLTGEERVEKCKRVRAWLELPNSGDVKQIVNDLLDIMVDTFVRDAFKRVYLRNSERGAPEGETEALAASSARLCRDQLRTLVPQDEDAAREALNATMSWWVKEERRTGSSGDLDDFLERCADQLAAVLVFKNLPPAEDTKTQIWWDNLLHRVAQHVILRQPGELVFEDDRVTNCVEAILERANNFTYQGLGQAINYFTKACSDRERQQSPQAETGPLPEPEPPLRVVPLPSKPSPSRPPFSFLWLTQVLGRREAIKYWILFMLQVNRQQNWDDIVKLVPQLCCGILSNADLPPDVSWDEVQQAFQAMAQRSRTNPGTLTAEALRQFYSRAKRELRRELPGQLWSMMVETLGLSDAVKKWVLHRLRDVYKLEWKDIALLALQSCCEILDDADLPPDVSFPDVQQAWKDLAQNSANPGTLTAEELRTFYDQTNEKLQRYVQELFEETPRR